MAGAILASCAAQNALGMPSDIAPAPLHLRKSRRELFDVLMCNLLR
jgi:hypothetical protein